MNTISPQDSTGADQTSSASVTSAERRWVMIFALVVMLVTTLPYLAGYSLQGDDWRFSGFVLGVEDGNSYIAKMLSGASGAWLFRTPYTVEPQNGVIAFLPYLLLGKLAAPPAMHEQLVVLFHLFRLGAGILDILVTYYFLAFFIHDFALRRYGLVLASLGGGLGWILTLTGGGDWLGSPPLDFYSPETFGFLELYGLPHLALARAGLLWIIICYLSVLRNGETKLLKNGILIGAVWLGVALAQPLTAILVGFVLGLHITCLIVIQLWQKLRLNKTDWFVARKAILLSLASFLFPAPFLIYNALKFSLDPFLRQWTAQNIITSPHPLHYLLAYGLVIPFAIMGAKKLFAAMPLESWLLVPWCLALPLLAYAPFNLQRRLPEGIWVALVTLAVIAFDDMDLRRPRWKVWGSRVLLIFSLPSALILLAVGSVGVASLGEPIFRPIDEVRAFEYIATTVQSGEVVLTDYDTGNPLPAWAAVRVVIGHGPESMGLAQLKIEIERFFDQSTSDAVRQTFLAEKNVSYVLISPGRAMPWMPENNAYLELVFESNGYRVYRVKGQ